MKKPNHRRGILAFSRRRLPSLSYMVYYGTYHNTLKEN